MKYKSDRGDKYEISKMETSHLVNVLGHHITQTETLKILLQDHPHPRLSDRITVLRKIINVLVDELTKREVGIREYISRS